MAILAGKRVLITGVTAGSSVAYEVARIAQAEGAQVIVTCSGRALNLVEDTVRHLDPTPPILELDVMNPEHLSRLAGEIEARLGGLDGIVHSIAFADPELALGGKFLSTEWPEVEAALRVSAYSLVELVRACKSVLAPGASIVSLTFDGTVTWPTYDWMGVATATLESVSRYVARYVSPSGVRANAVSAGPINTLAKQAINPSETFDAAWRERSLLEWDPDNATPVAQAVVALLSDWFPMTTGDIIHVDGGVHSTAI
jgi:enoyl-[acyl-carrier protein] reductase I